MRMWICRLGITAALPLVILPLALTAKAQTADFNCENPKTAFERLACGKIITTIQGNENGLMVSEQEELAKLDDELNAIYRDGLAKHFDPELLRREQQEWLKALERCALDDNCAVSSLYRDRIANLRYDLAHPPQSEADRKHARLLSMGSPPGDNFTFHPGATSKGYGLGICESLIRWLNHVIPKGDINSDESGIRATRMPGLSFPAWQELDIRQHLDLFAKIVEFKERKIMQWPLSQVARRQIEAARMGKIRLWMVKEDVHRLADGKPETLITYGEPHTEDVIKSQEGPKQIFGPRPVAVTEDLRDVDIEATRWILGFELCYFKGKPYFVSLGGSDAYAHGPQHGCAISNFKPEREEK